MQILKYGNGTVIYLQRKGIHGQPQNTAEEALDCSFVAEYGYVLGPGQMLELVDNS